MNKLCNPENFWLRLEWTVSLAFSSLFQCFTLVFCLRQACRVFCNLSSLGSFCVKFMCASVWKHFLLYLGSLLTSVFSLPLISFTCFLVPSCFHSSSAHSAFVCVYMYLVFHLDLVVMCCAAWMLLLCILDFVLGLFWIHVGVFIIQINSLSSVSSRVPLKSAFVLHSQFQDIS